ncbi:hypothetical protein SeMB42_g07294 [Synchytrium endobioticum]|uniref:Cytochrome P450 n=1 Tax=Synchytrium endobioticum TaxID=286115 RepID=A0A507CAR7_9FUNG|nr:hypothetical protein SeMB42_g07294 [Synchytrium endobioticum]
MPYSKRKKSHEYFIYLANKYGRIARLVVGTEPLILINDAAEAKKVLVSPDFEKSTRLPRLMIGLADHGIAGLVGEEHRRHRKYLLPALGPNHLKIAAQASVDATHKVMSQWGLHATVDFLKCMNAITTDVIARVTLGQDVNAVAALQLDELPPHLRDLSLVTEIIAARTYIPEILWKPNGLAKQDAIEKTKSVRLFLQTIIDKRKKDWNDMDPNERIRFSTMSQDEKLRATANWTLVDRLLSANYCLGKTIFDDRDISDEVCSFFQGGTDTTALSLTTLVVFMARYPNVAQKVYDEIDMVLGKDGIVTYDSLSRFRYLECVIKETMRLENAASATQYRTPSKQSIVCGYKIYPGDAVVVNTIALHRNPLYWDHPDEFKPERWADGFVPTPGSYLPFGDGGANCIGQRLAMLETRLVAATMLQHYQFDIAPGQKVNIISSATVGYKSGLKIIVKRRN